MGERYGGMRYHSPNRVQSMSTVDRFGHFH